VPFSKTTRPVGVPLNSGVTVAVKVTDCPKVDGFSVEISEVVLLALPTNNFTALDVLEMKIASPLYTALIAYDPLPKKSTSSLHRRSVWLFPQRSRRA